MTEGGHIYVLPSDKFISDPNKGLGEYEWTSKESVSPIDKIEFPSTLDAMIKNGVQVYFVEPSEFNKIEPENKDAEVIKNFESENQK